MAAVSMMPSANRHQARRGWRDVVRRGGGLEVGESGCPTPDVKPRIGGAGGVARALLAQACRVIAEVGVEGLGWEEGGSSWGGGALPAVFGGERGDGPDGLLLEEDGRLRDCLQRRRLALGCWDRRNRVLEQWTRREPAATGARCHPAT